MYVSPFLQSFPHERRWLSITHTHTLPPTVPPLSPGDPGLPVGQVKAGDTRPHLCSTGGSQSQTSPAVTVVLEGWKGDGCFPSVEAGGQRRLQTKGGLVWSEDTCVSWAFVEQQTSSSSQSAPFTGTLLRFWSCPVDALSTVRPCAWSPWCLCIGNALRADVHLISSHTINCQQTF